MYPLDYNTAHSFCKNSLIGVVKPLACQFPGPSGKRPPNGKVMLTVKPFGL